MKFQITSVFFFVGLLVSPSLANSEYFRIVQETAKIYRVEVTIDNMKLISDGQGGRTFHIDLKSNRNNFEMVMLVGYIASGEAMKHTGIEPSSIHVSIDVPLGEGYRLMTMSTSADVKRLLSEEVNMAQFSRLVKYL